MSKIDLAKKFDLSAWQSFLAECFANSKTDLKRAPTPENINANPFDLKKCDYLGASETTDGKLLGFYYLRVPKNCQLDRNKVGLRNMLHSIWRKDVDGALIVFDQPESGKWRFSYVSDTKAHGQTASKRYTYLLGEGENTRTAEERFAVLIDKKGGIKLSDIADAFSVEKLSKEFYKELFAWYESAQKKVNFPADVSFSPDGKDEDKARNSTLLIRFITRMIFVWFLRQKKLIPAELFDKNTMDKIINYQDKTHSTYYKAIIQNLFFATLNLEPKDGKRKFIKGQYGCTYYRYERFFKDKEAFLKLTEKIPFLNGGLFENLDQYEEKKPTKRIDCFSDNPKNETRLTFPDELFFDKKLGIIPLLNKYNFTVEENTPIEQDVSLDPELLGKVFENLLGTYNPETRESARKATGSFYTPREIVQYMVNESLLSYLQTQIPNFSHAESVRNILNYHEVDIANFSASEKRDIVKALFDCNIIDPACGSGAFPMGVLQQMVLLLNTFDADNKQWKEIVQQKFDQDEIARNFDENSPDYARKLYLIENCIFGVDIQPIAVQIAKLRFFISLVLEQKGNDSQNKNFGIRPLPNLETKFVAANTLIGVGNKSTDQQQCLVDEEIKDAVKQLKTIRHKHFSARTAKTKNEYRKKDKSLRKEIAKLLRNDGWENDAAEKVAQWDPYNQNTYAAWFDPE